MFCPNCGTNIPEGTKFCPKCGARLDEETPGQQKAGGSAQGNGTSGPGNTRQQGTQSTLNDTVSKYRKKMTPRIIGIIIAAVVVIAIIVVLIVVLSNNGGGGSTTVDLNNYVEITAEGYDGYGTVTYHFDDTTFVNDYAEKVAYRTENGSAQPSVSAARSLAERVADAGTFTADEDLSNGDKTTFSWDFNPEEIEDLYDVNLKYEDITYTVEGLEELEEVDVLDGGELDGDVFEGVTVEFSGISPKGTATLNVSNSIDGVDSSMFTLSQSTWLANGDTVTVEITDEGKAALAEKCGIVPTETSKEFTVEGLSYYASDASQIPDDALKTAWTQVEENYSDYLNTQWILGDDEYRNDYSRKFESMNYLGYYFFVNEDTGNNELVLVYEINALQAAATGEGHWDDGLVAPLKYYWFAYYPDIIIEPNGSCSIPRTYNDLTDLFGEDAPSFDYTTLYKQYSDYAEFSKNYIGYEYLDEMISQISNQFAEYTIVNDTVTQGEGSETDEGSEGEEPAPEENNEGEGEAPEENNEGEQQEGD